MDPVINQSTLPISLIPLKSLTLPPILTDGSGDIRLALRELTLDGRSVATAPVDLTSLLDDSYLPSHTQSSFASHALRNQFTLADISLLTHPFPTGVCHLGWGGFSGEMAQKEENEENEEGLLLLPTTIVKVRRSGLLIRLLWLRERGELAEMLHLVRATKSYDMLKTSQFTQLCLVPLIQSVGRVVSQTRGENEMGGSSEVKGVSEMGDVSKVRGKGDVCLGWDTTGMSEMFDRTDVTNVIKSDVYSQLLSLMGDFLSLLYLWRSAIEGDQTKEMTASLNSLIKVETDLVSALTYSAHPTLLAHLLTCVITSTPTSSITSTLASHPNALSLLSRRRLSASAGKGDVGGSTRDFSFPPLATFPRVLGPSTRLLRQLISLAAGQWLFTATMVKQPQLIASSPDSSPSPDSVPPHQALQCTLESHTLRSTGGFPDLNVVGDVIDSPHRSALLLGDLIAELVVLWWCSVRQEEGEGEVRVDKRLIGECKDLCEDLQIVTEKASKGNAPEGVVNNIRFAVAMVKYICGEIDSAVNALIVAKSLFAFEVIEECLIEHSPRWTTSTANGNLLTEVTGVKNEPSGGNSLDQVEVELRRSVADEEMRGKVLGVALGNAINLMSLSCNRTVALLTSLTSLESIPKGNELAISEVCSALTNQQLPLAMPRVLSTYSIPLGSLTSPPSTSFTSNESACSQTAFLNEYYLHRYLKAMFYRNVKATLKYHPLQVSLFCRHQPHLLLEFLQRASGSYDLEEALNCVRGFRGASDGEQVGIGSVRPSGGVIGVSGVIDATSVSDVGLLLGEAFLLSMMGCVDKAMEIYLNILEDIPRSVGLVLHHRDTSLWSKLLSYVSQPRHQYLLSELIGYCRFDFDCSPGHKPTLTFSPFDCPSELLEEETSTEGGDEGVETEREDDSDAEFFRCVEKKFYRFKKRPDTDFQPGQATRRSEPVESPQSTRDAFDEALYRLNGEVSQLCEQRSEICEQANEPREARDDEQELDKGYGVGEGDATGKVRQDGEVTKWEICERGSSDKGDIEVEGVEVKRQKREQGEMGDVTEGRDLEHDSADKCESGGSPERVKTNRLHIRETEVCGAASGVGEGESSPPRVGLQHLFDTDLTHLAHPSRRPRRRRQRGHRSAQPNSRFRGGSESHSAVFPLHLIKPRISVLAHPDPLHQPSNPHHSGSSHSPSDSDHALPPPQSTSHSPGSPQSSSSDHPASFARPDPAFTLFFPLELIRRLPLKQLEALPRLEVTLTRMLRQLDNHCERYTICKELLSTRSSEAAASIIYLQSRGLKVDKDAPDSPQSLYPPHCSTSSRPRSKPIPHQLPQSFAPPTRPSGPTAPRRPASPEISLPHSDDVNSSHFSELNFKSIMTFDQLMNPQVSPYSAHLDESATRHPRSKPTPSFERKLAEIITSVITPVGGQSEVTPVGDTDFSSGIRQPQHGPHFAAWSGEFVGRFRSAALAAFDEQVSSIEVEEEGETIGQLNEGGGGIDTSGLCSVCGVSIHDQPSESLTSLYPVFKRNGVELSDYHKLGTDFSGENELSPSDGWKPSQTKNALRNAIRGSLKLTPFNFSKNGHATKKKKSRERSSVVGHGAGAGVDETPQRPSLTISRGGTMSHTCCSAVRNDSSKLTHAQLFAPAHRRVSSYPMQLPACSQSQQ
eukprot:GHVN01090518.1.p1 GENE.GHVN01090518.1~~GHVN01090518.1.p1  ORF type:complete len:1762 (+),score=400.77 GHVN01090518.1:334-5286(+)